MYAVFKNECFDVQVTPAPIVLYRCKNISIGDLCVF